MGCQETELCSAYTWYGPEHLYHGICLLFSQCGDYFFCQGCHSGPEDCGMPTTTTTTTTTFTHSSCDPQIYLELNDPSRSVFAGPGDQLCDSEDLDYTSPDWQGPGWYRFTSTEFSQLADYPPGSVNCGTIFTGWLDGDHPTLEEGEVTRRICFQEGTSFEYQCWQETEAGVVNCGEYFVYHLREPPRCYARYCGM